MFKILIFFWIFLLLISIFYVINNLMQKKENFNVSEVENDINSRNKIYLQTNVIDVIPGKPGPKGDEGNKGEDGTEGLSGEDGIIGNSGNDGDDAATVLFNNPNGIDAVDVSVRNTNTEDIHTIDIPYGKKGDLGDTHKLNYCYIGKDMVGQECTNESELSPNDMYLFIPKGLPGENGVLGDCSMESPGFPGPQGDMGPSGDKGEKGPRGLDGKRGIDANKLNIGSNVMGVEYKICFEENNPDHCIDVPMLKAINQDYQDKIDNKPYEDILLNTNNNYVPVLLRRINRLKKDLCLAHLTGDYSNGYITDIKKDLYETYTVFNVAEGDEFKTNLYYDDIKLNEYCAKLFNIVTANFIFNKKETVNCNEVDLYNFIKTNLQELDKWEDRFNTYKNTPVVDIKFEDGTGITSSSKEKAALIIDVDKIFEIFPNIYEIILNVERFITGKHGPSGATADLWTGKDPDKLNGGKGQDGNDGGPAIEIIYKGTNNLKEIIIRINELGGPEPKIAGGFGSLGGEGGKASKSYTKTFDRKKSRKKIDQEDEEVCDPAIPYNGPGSVGENGRLDIGEQAWVRGHGNHGDFPGVFFDMIVFGRYHLISKHGPANVPMLKSNPSAKSGQYWKFEISEDKQIRAGGSGGYSDGGKRDDFNCTTYKFDNDEYKSDLDGKFFFGDAPSFNSSPASWDIANWDIISYNKSDWISPPTGGRNYGLCCTNCRKTDFLGMKFDSMSRPKDGASWYGFTAQKCKMEARSPKPEECLAGQVIDDDYCCPNEFPITNCTEILKINENGSVVTGEPGKYTTGADGKNASDKTQWDIDKAERPPSSGHFDAAKYSEVNLDIAGYTELEVGTPGNRGDDGKDGDIINTNNIQDTTKVIIFLNGYEYTYY